LLGHEPRWRLQGDWWGPARVWARQPPTVAVAPGACLLRFSGLGVVEAAEAVVEAAAAAAVAVAALGRGRVLARWFVGR
jgi:hypothetical protein